MGVFFESLEVSLTFSKNKDATERKVDWI